MRPKLSWDWGTAYDFFFSVTVLFAPDEFGLRGAWAAGVRSRLSQSARDFLQDVTFAPVHWIYWLPQPKDSATALDVMAEVPPAERFFTIAWPDAPEEVYSSFRDVAARETWNERDMEQLKRTLSDQNEKPKEKELRTMLNWAAQPEAFGEGYLNAMENYREVFFEEEEARIEPVLKQALEQAQAQAEQLPLNDLLEVLSQGIRFAQPVEAEELVMVPVFWTTPLIIENQLGPGLRLFGWGARPADMSLVPGEAVPALMLQSLKALADPTRLRILRYLAEEPMTPTDLAHRLRLRAPTVVHHLLALRLARLVYLTLEEGVERRYALRYEAVLDNLDTLKAFLTGADKNGGSN